MSGNAIADAVYGQQTAQKMNQPVTQAYAGNPYAAQGYAYAPKPYAYQPPTGPVHVEAPVQGYTPTVKGDYSYKSQYAPSNPFLFSRNNVFSRLIGLDNTEGNTMRESE